MQSLYGKLRLFSKQTINNVRNEAIASFKSNFLGCSVNQSSRVASEHSNFSSALFLNQNLCTGNVSWASSKGYCVASTLPLYRGLSSVLHHSGSSIFNVPTRNIATASASQDVSVSSDTRRIKFKRLDKTGRHIMQIIDKEAVEEVKGSREIPDIKPGYIVQLKVEVPDNKRRVSIIKGIVIARRNAGLNTTFRIRRTVAGVGIEHLFHLYSPNIKEIKVLDKKKVRRAKLYYLRDRMNPLKNK